MTDARGDGIPGVILTLINTPLSLPSVSARTDLTGQFTFVSVIPGDGYEVKASLPDYATVVAGPFRLKPAELKRIVLTLEPSAQLEEVVRVEARGAIVDLESTSTGVTYGSEFVEGVPLVGRQFTDILTMAPGVTDADQDGSPNVHGGRETSFQLRLDSTDITNPLTALVGQTVNLETIEEVEIVTTGASAEYGGVSGGFANVITRSGGNDFQGSLKLFFRSNFLDGDGANDVDPPPEFTSTNVYFTTGGPFVRDKFWYFASLEGLDEESPVVFIAGGHAIRKASGWRAFGKLTWEPHEQNRLSLQINYDPIDVTGNNIGAFTSEETDFRLSSGGPLVQLTWNVITPMLLLNSVFSHLDGRLVVQPLSPAYREIGTSIVSFDDDVRHAAIDPCDVPGCLASLRRFVAQPTSPRSKAPTVYRESGAWNERGTEDLERTTMRSNLSYTIEEVGGQHTLKTGFEVNVETYEELAHFNPILTGSLMDIFDPEEVDSKAEGLALGVWAQDSWKPRPGLAFNVGLRYDGQSIETFARTHIDPVEEVEEVLGIWDLWCDAAGHRCTSTHTPGRLDGEAPYVFPIPPGHPAAVYDLNGDGLLERAGEEGDQIRNPFTEHHEWTREPFEVSDSNVAPRMSVSWDPWADGRTKFFGSYGVFNDRIFLGAVTKGQLPERQTARFLILASGALSEPIFGSAINQVDPQLQSPYTVEWTAGFERELAPEWSVGLTYINRRGEDLLQDVDVNHITCDQFDEALGVDPYAVCGDGGLLEQDKFGRVVFGPGGGTYVPNGAPDLYVHNPHFNQILEVGNYNELDYTAWELILRKRLHMNWQMMLGYTLSKARGEAESFDTLSGNDAAVSDLSSGYLDYDRRHVFKCQVVAHLEHGLLAGGSIEWASGLPYTFLGIAEGDIDDMGNITSQRIFSITGQNNDQRNDAVLTVNGRLEKRFDLGNFQASAFIEAENLLDANDLHLLRVDDGNRNLGTGTAGSDHAIVTEGDYNYGRRWEIGASFLF